MKKTLSIISLVVLSACTQVAKDTSTPIQTSQTEAQQKVPQSESERLNQWFETKHEESLLQSPMALTQLGRKERYDELDDFSEAAEDKKLAWKAHTVATLKSTFNYDALNEEAKISYDLWVYQYESAKAQAPYRRRAYVFTQMHGPHTGMPNFLINYHRVDELSDMTAYIKRVAELSRVISQLLERTKIHANEGVRPPVFAYNGVIQQSKNLLQGQPFEKSEHDSPLLADLKTEIQGLLTAKKIDAAQAKDLNTQAQLALLTHFQPAYQNLITWFEQDLVNVPKQATGVGALPDGEAFYNAALLNATTTNLKADEIHQIGLQEVARILGLMEQIKTSVEFKGSLQDFFAYIKSDLSNEQFYYANNDTGRQGYLDDSSAYLGYIKSKLPEYFGLLPKADLVVKRVEAFRELPGAAQHYSPGTPDGSRSGVYYAHLSDMTSMPKNEMEAIAYHEGNPGHHMQISIAQELENIPQFRTQAFFTSYNEGWALYAELLAKEMGAYNTPYTDFGRLVTEIWRAIRLVVDTGIHSKGWTEQQAIAYFKQNSPISEGQITSEVQRYFVWPSQATSYKIGMLKILELRTKAQRELGDKFDIKRFHDVVLGGGSVPMQVLERMVDSWIEKNKM